MRKKMFVVFLLFLIGSAVAGERFQNATSRIVAKLYDIYKNQKYRDGLAITTGTIYKKFKKFYDYQRMNNGRIPQQLTRLAGQMSGFKVLDEFKLQHKGKEYSIVHCIWVIKYKDNTAQSSGLIKTKWIVRAYLLKKENNEWKISSEKFITEHLFRGEERELMNKIYKIIAKQNPARISGRIDSVD